MMPRTTFLCLLLCCSAALAADPLRRPVHQIHIIGNNKTTEGTILRESTFDPGDSVSETDLLETQHRIYNLGLFNSVLVSGLRDSITGFLDVYVLVSERWYIWPQFSIGVKDRDWAHTFSEGSKLFVGLGVVHYNVRGRREKLFIGGVFGYDPYGIVEYDFLALDSARSFLLNFNAKTSRTRNQSDTQYTHGIGFNEVRYSGAAEVTYRASRRLNIMVHGELQALNLSSPDAHLTLNPSGTDVSPIVLLQGVYDTRDNAEYATGGEYLIGALSKVGAGTYINYGAAGVDLREYLPLFGGIALCGRASATLVYGGNVPVYSHQFLGLGERVRGEWAVKREGEDLAIGSLEARIPLFGPKVVTWTDAPAWFPGEFSTGLIGVFATLFADAGNAWFRGDDVINSRWSNGVGAGLNILLTYGTILRFEYAFHGSASNGEFIFDVGASF